MAVDILYENDAFVDQLRLALRDGEAGLSDVPLVLKNVLRDQRWRERRIKTGEVIKFDHFEEFVARKPLEGLGADMGLIKRICDGDSEAMDLLDRATQREAGRPKEMDNNVIHLESKPKGNSEAYALRRLRKDRPDLHARVLSGEFSAHGAMVKAGFRKKLLTVPLDVRRAATVLAKHFTREEFAEIVSIATPLYETA
jgi:hypothetical protein